MASKTSHVYYEQERERIDRFSHLPDDILHRILSLLDDTKSTVQTSILSKRWRCLWKHVTVLLREDSSEKFVRNFLSLRSRHATLDHVSYVSFIDLTDTEHGLETIFKSIAGRHHLESLELVGCSGVSLATIAQCFRTLTTLELRDCLLRIPSSDDDDPFADLPSLNRLKLVGSVSKVSAHNFPLKVTGHRLRSLKIGGEPTLVGEVLAPKLEWLDFSGHVSDVQAFRPLDLPSLDGARVLLWSCGCPVDVDALASLLRGLRNAKSLDLCFEYRSYLKPPKSFFTEVKSMIENEISRFTRLKTRKIQYPYEQLDFVNI